MRVKFCFLLEKTAPETVTMLKEAFKDEAIGKTQVYEWFKVFKRGEMSVEDQLHCGCSSGHRNDKNIEEVCQAVLAYHRWTNDKISEITGVLWSLC
jgi:hypothetical protein